jgi:glucose/arabinose dehydrogenase
VKRRVAGSLSGRRLLAVALGLATSLSGRAEAAEPTSELVASGFANPLYATSPPRDGERLFVVEQGTSGQASIHIVDLTTGAVLAPPFLTLSGLQTSGERGLLGLAFHPDYASNRRFFVNYTEPGQASGEAAV